MAKTEKPLLGLGAHGTVGGAITYQKRGGITVIREKPFPKQPDTLAQQYQRWLYEDYCYRWRQQTAAVKQTYQTAGVPYHLTGFQYWMKYHLKNLPDIAGYWKLDEATGAVAYDSSRNLNHGTIIGASPATGPIDGALLFDGINDYVTIVSSPSVTLPPSFTLEANVQYLAPAMINPNVAAKRDSYFLGLSTTRFLRSGCNDGAWHVKTALTNQLPVGATVRIACILDEVASEFRQYVNGVKVTQIGGDGYLWPPISTIHPLLIGAYRPGTQQLNAIIDHVIFYTRVLDTTELLRNSQRRYP